MRQELQIFGRFMYFPAHIDFNQFGVRIIVAVENTIFLLGQSFW